MIQSLLKRVLGYPQADPSALTHEVQSNEEVESRLGRVIYQCARTKQDSDVKTSNAVGAFFIGILIATLSTVAVTMLLVTFGVVEKHVAVLGMLAGIIVVSPLAIAVTYLRGRRNLSRFRFDLHERGVRYLSNYWNTRDIVAVRPMSSVRGLDQRPLAQVFLFFKPRIKQGIREIREDTIHFELIDGTKPNLVTALECFQREGVVELVHKMGQLNPAIEMDWESGS